MDRRFTTFMLLVAVIFIANQLFFSWLFPPEPDPKKDDKAKQVAKADPAKAADVKAAEAPAEPAAGDAPAGDAPAEKAEGEAKPAVDKAPAAEVEVPERWGWLGSADSNSPYRMSVLWTNRGAAVVKVELNGERYRDLEDRSGYLGYLAPADAPGRAGAVVRAVGVGTPAAKAGLQVDDVITAIDGTKITSAAGFIAALQETKPDQTIAIEARRGDATQKLSAELGWRPLEVIHVEHDSKPVDVILPGKHDPFSMLLTVAQYDDRTLSDDNKELGGVNLRDGQWEVAAANEDSVTFRKALPALGLEVTKTYRLAKVPADQLSDQDYPAYHLLVDVKLANTGDAAHKVGYRLDGPTGLPVEGAWYANKVSRTWGTAGMRDVIVKFNNNNPEQIACTEIAAEDFKRSFPNYPLDYSAVDAQYFAGAVLPLKKQPDEVWFSDVRPMRVGEVPKEPALKKLTNVSFRLDSVVMELAPGGKALEHQFQVFIGPKRPNLLANYGQPNASLSELVYYGWFGWVAKPMLLLLHFFYHVLGNYGLAIVMLTVLVRSAMFPVSRKQALNAQKMQELQPEIRRLTEKYKNEPEKRTKAQQELFRQHKYNPLAGCLPLFLQMPIFVGLYRSLMVDVELRQAPLVSETVRWASNLAAPDMLWNWSHIMPEFVSQGTGFFGLGPYLNILPIGAIALMMWQQKMTMPPPADEQAAMQQKMMKYMSLFMLIIFFKVAAGLCVYFIASSVWGLCERKLLPKASKPGAAGVVAAAPPVASTNNGAGNGAAAKRRQRGRK